MVVVPRRCLRSGPIECLCSVDVVVSLSRLPFQRQRSRSVSSPAVVLRRSCSSCCPPTFGVCCVQYLCARLVFFRTARHDKPAAAVVLASFNFSVSSAGLRTSGCLCCTWHCVFLNLVLSFSFEGYIAGLVIVLENSFLTLLLLVPQTTCLPLCVFVVLVDLVRNL